MAAAAVRVAVGGAAAEELPGALLLPDRIEDSVATLKRALTARG